MDQVAQCDDVLMDNFDLNQDWCGSPAARRERTDDDDDEMLGADDDRNGSRLVSDRDRAPPRGRGLDQISPIRPELRPQGKQATRE